MNLHSELNAFRPIVLNALNEDLGSGDITTDSIFDPLQRSRARIVAKEEGVIAGLPVAALVFQTLDESFDFTNFVVEGDRIMPGQTLAELSGPTGAILKGERVALNFLQLMSGVATKTARYVERVAKFNLKVVDTRKTIPGLRLLQKYAVRVGGGSNHRFGLYDGILIKDNHIDAAGGIIPAVKLARNRAPMLTKIEVETRNLDEVRQALEAGADVIMLDNMPVALMREAVKLINGRALVEASGGITLENIEEVADTGVDFISVGALTKDVDAIDISLIIVT